MQTNANENDANENDAFLEIFAIKDVKSEVHHPLGAEVK